MIDRIIKPSLPALGIMLLDTKFPRIPGDVGHPSSYPFPIRKITIPGATIKRAVYEADASLLESFIKGARQLESERCLCHHEQLRVPFTTSKGSIHDGKCSSFPLFALASTISLRDNSRAGRCTYCQ